MPRRSKDLLSCEFARGLLDEAALAAGRRL
jgi:hypothetical protein